jgi:NAD(P)-dependent dehydrogenase (short-subunit alcohol dehydrogenase family)
MWQQSWLEVRLNRHSQKTTVKYQSHVEIPFAKEQPEPHGITVNTVLPGLVMHSLQSSRLPKYYKAMIQCMQCIPQPLDCDSLADTVTFLSSDAEVFITGQELAVDGGLTHGG